MNFFQLINLCMLEVNYKPENYFENYTKPDHIKFKNLINRVNTEICQSDDWNFRRVKTSLNIDKNHREYELPFNGKISKIFNDKNELVFNPDYAYVYMNNSKNAEYSIFNNKLLISSPDDCELTIYYCKDTAAKDAQGNDKAIMEFQEDVSLIPEEFAEPLLVYGACLRFKSALQHPKYSFWSNEFLKTYKNLRVNSLMTEASTPIMKISKRTI